jgi:predicted permease
MTITRLLALVLIIMLALRLLPLVLPLLGERWRQTGRRLAATIDVAGGLIVLGLTLLTLLRGERLGALLLALLGIPVFIGAYRALPAWWRGDS